MSLKRKFINGALALLAVTLLIPAGPAWAVVDTAAVSFDQVTHTARKATLDGFEIWVGDTELDNLDSAAAGTVTVGVWHENDAEFPSAVNPQPTAMTVASGVYTNSETFANLTPHTQYTFRAQAQALTAGDAYNQSIQAQLVNNKSAVFTTDYLTYDVGPASNVTHNNANVTVRLFDEDPADSSQTIPFAGANGDYLEYKITGTAGGTSIPDISGTSTSAINASGVSTLTFASPLPSMSNITLEITGAAGTPAWEDFFDYANGRTVDFVTAPAPTDARVRAAIDPAHTTSRALTVDVWLTCYDAGAQTQVLDDDINGTLRVNLEREDGTVIASNVSVEIDDGYGRVSFLNGIDPSTAYHLVVTDVSGLTPAAAPAVYANWRGYEHPDVDRFRSAAPDSSSSAGSGGSGGTTPDGDDDNPPAPPAPGTTVVSETPASDGTFETKARITTESGASATSVAVDEDAADVAKLKGIGLDVTVVGAEVVISGKALDIGVFDIPITVNGTEAQTVRVEIKPIEHTDETFVDTAPTVVQSAWKTELTTSGSDTLFETYIPTSLTTDAVSDASATGTGISGTKVTLVGPASISGRGAGEKYFKVTGVVSDYAAATIKEISYRVGINKYIQTADVKLSATDVNDKREEEPTGGSGGGCDAGAGLAGLLAATGAAALLRRKG